MLASMMAIILAGCGGSRNSGEGAGGGGGGGGGGGTPSPTTCATLTPTAGVDTCGQDMLVAAAAGLAKNFLAGQDVLTLTAQGSQTTPAPLIQLRFTSANVGNGVATASLADGELLGSPAAANRNTVKISVPSAASTQAAYVDDEGITFRTPASTSMEVIDAVSGVSRGAAFRVVGLGTAGADTFVAATADAAVPHYFNAGAGDDALTGGDAADVLVGGKGANTLSGGKGADVFILPATREAADKNVLSVQPGDTAITFTGSVSAATVAGFDTAINFSTAAGDSVKVASPIVAQDYALGFLDSYINSTANDGMYDINGGSGTAAFIKSHSISDGIITFYDADGTSGNPVTINTPQRLAAALEYLLKQDLSPNNNLSVSIPTTPALPSPPTFGGAFPASVAFPYLTLSGGVSATNTVLFSQQTNDGSPADQSTVLLLNNVAVMALSSDPGAVASGVLIIQ